MSQDCLVSVIVLNWNGKRFIDGCLSSLVNQDFQGYEILFVDNGSSDDSVNYVHEKFGMYSNVKVVPLFNNFGFSKGNNLAAMKFAQGKYIIILNNDTIVSKNFVKHLFNMAKTDSTIASVGCRILQMNGKTWFSQKFTNKGFIAPIFLQNIISQKIDQISSNFNINLANSGCACLFRKDVFIKIGGYDEDFISDWEDWDLGYRINLAGYKSVHMPIFLVSHIGGGTAGYSPSRLERIYKNSLFTQIKNYDSVNLLTHLPVYYLFLLPLSHIGFIIYKMLSEFRTSNKERVVNYWLALPKSYLSFLIDLKIYWRKRYFIQTLRKTPDKIIFKKTRHKNLF